MSVDFGDAQSSPRMRVLADDDWIKREHDTNEPPLVTPSVPPMAFAPCAQLGRALAQAPTLDELPEVPEEARPLSPTPTFGGPLLRRRRHSRSRTSSSASGPSSCTDVDMDADAP